LKRLRTVNQKLFGAYAGAFKEVKGVKGAGV
jgi:hypothetical protein